MNIINLEQLKGFMNDFVTYGSGHTLCRESTVFLKDDWENYPNELHKRVATTGLNFNSSIIVNLHDENWVDTLMRLAQAETNIYLEKTNLIILTHDSSVGEIKHNDALTKLCGYHRIGSYTFKPNTALLLFVSGDSFEHDCVDHCDGYSITH